VLRLVTSAAGLAPSDVVIEVGPGLGVLTRELARQAGWLFTIELDSKLAAILGSTLASFSNVTIINDDVLKVDPAALLQEEQMKFPVLLGIPLGYKVVANLPYYITSPVLRHFLEASLRPQVIVVMVQKEVAEAILSQGLKLPKAEVLSLLGKVGIRPERRAETLTLEEWAELWRVLTHLEERKSHADSFSTS